MSIKHWLAHRLGWNGGRIASWLVGDTVMIGFLCSCGSLSGIHESLARDKN